MSEHIKLGHGAFTWTGSYGCGKSSLAVALGALLSGTEESVQIASELLGPNVTRTVNAALPRKSRGWRLLPVVGRRGRPAQIIGESLIASNLVRKTPDEGWNHATSLKALSDIAVKLPRASGGLIVFLDEMGKMLESSAHESSDIHFFQDLAEQASRSNGRLIVVGILHQAFAEYAHRLASEIREEWAKVQGRYVDLALNVDSDEQIEILTRAIKADRESFPPGKIARNVAALFGAHGQERRARNLERCWPLHPIVALLLGSIGRRRFGQNQRSVFGFLNSAEPHGFQSFLRQESGEGLYTPDLLWEYLRANLEPAIMASPDGHRWSTAIDAINRCRQRDGSRLHIKLLRTIALLTLFSDRANLAVNRVLLGLAMHTEKSRQISAALKDLQDWSMIVHRNFDNSFNVFEGSDFDIDAAVASQLNSTQRIEFEQLESLAQVRPVVAKRHFHETGALRWFDFKFCDIRQMHNINVSDAAHVHAAGLFLLAFPSNESRAELNESWAKTLVKQTNSGELAIGIATNTKAVSAQSRELFALEQIRDRAPELRGDRIARREIDARMGLLRERVERGLSEAIDCATWYVQDRSPKQYTSANLNSLASDLADEKFPKSPRVKNELLNRTKPSGSAIAARNALLRRMVLNVGERRLGFNSFSAEAGLFDSLLSSTGLYKKIDGRFGFVEPEDSTGSGANPQNVRLAPMWEAAIAHLKRHAHRAVEVTEIYEIWKNRPFGVKDGLLPVYLVALILAVGRDLVTYRQGVYLVELADFETDLLSKDPGAFQLRWMNLSRASQQLLVAIARESVGHDAQRNSLPDPLFVARNLIAAYDQLPFWVKRTQTLSENATKLRQLFRQAIDPNKLIFDEVPKALMAHSTPALDVEFVAAQFRDSMTELQEAYSKMLSACKTILLNELDVAENNSSSIEELRDRAKIVSKLGGDLRVRGFASLLAEFDGSKASIERLIYLAANKPPAKWVDADIENAKVELADLAGRFNRLEAFAHVAGQPNRRSSLAVVIGEAGRRKPVFAEFAISNHDQSRIDGLKIKLAKAIQDEKASGNVALAALSKISVDVIEMSEQHSVQRPTVAANQPEKQ